MRQRAITPISSFATGTSSWSPAVIIPLPFIPPGFEYVVEYSLLRTNWRIPGLIPAGTTFTMFEIITDQDNNTIDRVVSVFTSADTGVKARSEFSPPAEPAIIPSQSRWQYSMFSVGYAHPINTALTGSFDMQFDNQVAVH